MFRVFLKMSLIHFISGVLILTFLYSYFYESELKHKVTDWESYHKRIIDGKNEKIYGALQKLKSSATKITSLEDELQDVKSDAKRYLAENQQLRNKLVIEIALTEEMQLVLSSKDKRLARTEEELIKQRKSLDELANSLKYKEDELHIRELELIKREELLAKLPAVPTPLKRAKPLTYALYRVLYGEDFIQDSILSILDHVDKVFVFWDDRPWGDVKEAKYKGHMTKIPTHIDNVAGMCKILQLT